LEAYRHSKAVAASAAKTFGSLDEILKDLANNDVVLAEAIDSLIEDLNTATDEVSEDKEG